MGILSQYPGPPRDKHLRHPTETTAQDPPNNAGFLFPRAFATPPLPLVPVGIAGQQGKRKVRCLVGFDKLRRAKPDPGLSLPSRLPGDGPYCTGRPAILFFFIFSRSFSLPKGGLNHSFYRPVQGGLCFFLPGPCASLNTNNKTCEPGPVPVLLGTRFPRKTRVCRTQLL